MRGKRGQFSTVAAVGVDLDLDDDRLLADDLRPLPPCLIDDDLRLGLVEALDPLDRLPLVLIDDRLGRGLGNLADIVRAEEPDQGLPVLGEDQLRLRRDQSLYSFRC